MMERYNRTAMVLHWLIALALGFQFSIGFGMGFLGNSGFAVFQLHKSVGITILILSLARLAWRYTKPRPAALEHGFTGFLAKAVHFGLYVIMIGMPLTGWAIVSTSKLKVPTLLFGTLSWPHLPLGMGAHDPAEAAHTALAFIGILLFLLHIAGALRHQMMLKDGLVWRMVPGRSAALAGLLIALLPLGWVTGIFVVKGAASPAQVPAAVGDDVASIDNSADNAAAPANEALPAEREEVENASNAAEEALPAAPAKWAIQPGGTLGFSVDNGAGGVKGGFSKWNGTITLNPDAPEHGSDIRIDIDVASVSVGDPTQDSMLGGDDFFATSAHPKAVFRATNVRKSGVNRYTASGTLDLKGISRPQTLSFTLKGAGMKRAVSGSASIDRKAFQIGLGDSAASLAPSVKVSFSFDAVGTAAE